jgi:hypothetical protein
MEKDGETLQQLEEEGDAGAKVNSGELGLNR